MKKCLDIRANHENLELSHFLKNQTNQTKKVKKIIIPFFVFPPVALTLKC